LSEPPNEALAAAMADAQDQHDANISFQLANAEAAAKRDDAAKLAAEEYVRQQQQSEENADADEFGFSGCCRT
jgi:hypothetical protein